MSNRRKLKFRKEKPVKTVRQSALEKVDIPADEKTVLKRVPATIHWDQIKGIDRTDVEVIGEAVVYEDHSFDMILNPPDEMSDDARTLLTHASDKSMYSIGRPDGAP